MYLVLIVLICSAVHSRVRNNAAFIYLFIYLFVYLLILLPNDSDIEENSDY